MVRSKSLGVSFGRKQRIEGIVKNLSNKVRSEGVSSLFNGFQQESSEPLSLSSQQRTERRSSTVNDLTKSVYQLPSELEFSGVVSSQYLSKGKQFGPFVGTLTSLLEQPGFNHSLVCQIPDFDGNSYSLCLLTQELESSKWLKCIKSYTRGSYNVVAYNTPNGVMLQTVSDVGVGDELCIAYDLSYNTTEMKLDGDDVVYIGTKVVTAEQPVENINMREPVYASDDRSDSTYSVHVTEGQRMLDKSDTADDLPRPSEPTYRVMTADVTEDLNPTKEEEERQNNLSLIGGATCSEKQPACTNVVAAADNEVIDEFMKTPAENKNTRRSTMSWVGLFQKWAALRNLEERPEAYSVAELDKVLSRFYVEIRKGNGEDYEPDSLRVMQAGLDRFLKEKGYPKSILKDVEFLNSKKAMDGKTRKLRKNGFGNGPNKGKGLTKEDVEILWRRGQLGATNPRSLINTLWWLLTCQFGIRGRQKHYEMNVEDFSFEKDANGIEFLTLAEGVTKISPINSKIFAIGDKTRCPVSIFKQYLHRRPTALKTTGPLYLSVIDQPTSNVWYKMSRMGKNTIDSILRKMKPNEVSPEKELTDPSAGITVVKELESCGVAKCELKNIAGQKSEQGFDDSGDGKEQRMLSSLVVNDTSNFSSQVLREASQNHGLLLLLPKPCPCNVNNAAQASSRFSQVLCQKCERNRLPVLPTKPRKRLPLLAPKPTPTCKLDTSCEVTSNTAAVDNSAQASSCSFSRPKRRLKRCIPFFDSDSD